MGVPDFRCPRASGLESLTIIFGSLASDDMGASQIVGCVCVYIPYVTLSSDRLHRFNRLKDLVSTVHMDSQTNSPPVDRRPPHGDTNTQIPDSVRHPSNQEFVRYRSLVSQEITKNFRCQPQLLEGDVVVTPEYATTDTTQSYSLSFDTRDPVPHPIRVIVLVVVS